MVSAVERRKHARRRARIAQHRIEIDYSVIRAARANPRVDRLALDLVARRRDLKWRSRDNKPLDWSQRRAIDLEPLRVRALDQLLVALDNLIAGDLLGGTKSAGPSDADIVPARVHDHVGHASLAQHVPVEPGQRVRAYGVMKDSAAREPFVQDSHLMITGLIHQLVRELVWPPLVSVLRRIGAVRDRLAKGHNRPGLFGSRRLPGRQPV